MALMVEKVEVWAGEIQDQPGGLAEKLESLAFGGADFDFVIARRQHEKPGTGVVFVSPISGREAKNAAKKAGFTLADVPTLRVEGPDKPGVGGSITRAIAEAGITTRGVSAAVIGNKFVTYIGFDRKQDADKALRALRNLEPRKTTKKPAARPARRQTARAR